MNLKSISLLAHIFGAFLIAFNILCIWIIATGFGPTPTYFIILEFVLIVVIGVLHITSDLSGE